MKTAPYFAFYASDMMADKRYRYMTLAERGLLLSMMCECWVNKTVPRDPEAIGKFLGYQGGDIRAALTERVSSFFSEHNDDELVCPEIETYREKILANRVKQSKGGKKGAKQRWQGNSGVDGAPDESPTDSPNGVTRGRWIEAKRKEQQRLRDRQMMTEEQKQWADAYEKASRGQ